MIPTININLRTYLYILRRRWVPSVTVFLAVLAAGLAYAMFWPPVYEAVALVVVQPQKVPGGIVRSTVTTKMEERLQIITQQVLSRTRLMEIIERFDLYPQSRHRVAPDALAERMRKDVAIKITRQNYFTVSFTYAEPKATAAVVNALAAFYVDSNLRLREDDALGTANFLARELERMQAQLKEWEGKLTEFKEAHLHELPGSETNNLTILHHLSNKRDATEWRIFQNQKRIDTLENVIARLTADIEHLKMKKAFYLKQGVAVAGGEAGEGDSTNVEALQQRIERLTVRYTPDHPDVVRAKRELEVAEAKRAEEELKRQKAGKGEKEEEEPADAKAMELEIGSLKESRVRAAKGVADAKAKIKSLREEQAAIERSIVEVRQRIDNMPAVAERLQQLGRGYDVLETAYEKMHSKWLEANTAANLERTQRGEQFEVVDPAEVPTAPARPDVRRAIPMAMALAMALAVGLAFGLSYIDTSFTSVEQAESLGELPVLGVVPPLYTDQEISRRQRNLSFLIALYGSLGLFLLGLTAILFTGRGPALKALFTKIFG
jgi:polysaccharide chain length determinant protein (PEP-CTERM system associated)